MSQVRRLMRATAWVALALTAPLAEAQVVAALSMDETTRAIPSGSTFADHEILGSDTPGVYFSDLPALTGALPPQVNIDALDYVFSVTRDQIYFSLEENADVGGTVFADEDVIFWNGSTFSSAWDGSANGLPDRVNLDALDIESVGPLVFSFSLEETTNLVGPGVVEDEDIVRWNGSAFDAALVFDGSAEGVPVRADLDALSQSNMSFDAIMTVDSVTMDDGDLAIFDTGAFTGLFFDASSLNIAAAVDLDAAELKDSDLIPVELSVFGTD